MKHQLSDAAQAAASAPPMAVVGMTFTGAELDAWLKITGIVWLLLQMAWFVWSKIIRKDRGK